MSSYDPVFTDHFQHPRNIGKIESPSVESDVINQACMDRVHLTLRIESDQIAAARVMVHGCPQTIACASLLTTLIEDQPVSVALAIGREELAHALGGLPVNKRHAAALAIDALRTALENWSPEKRK